MFKHHQHLVFWYSVRFSSISSISGLKGFGPWRAVRPSVGLRRSVRPSPGLQVLSQREDVDHSCSRGAAGCGATALWCGSLWGHRFGSQEMWLWGRGCDKKTEDVGHTHASGVEDTTFGGETSDFCGHETVSWWSASACGACASCEEEVSSAMEGPRGEGMVPTIPALLVQAGQLEKRPRWNPFLRWSREKSPGNDKDYPSKLAWFWGLSVKSDWRNGFWACETIWSMAGFTCSLYHPMPSGCHWRGCFGWSFGDLSAGPERIRRLLRGYPPEAKIAGSRMASTGLTSDSLDGEFRWSWTLHFDVFSTI